VREGAAELSVLEELAAQTEERAAQTRWHADEARKLARADAARGDAVAESLHLGEALAHEGAARIIEETAALYRHRVARVRAMTKRRDVAEKAAALEAELPAAVVDFARSRSCRG
jgi:hypothetical protein